MKQKAKIYKGKRIVMGDKNLVTKNEIHVNDIPQEGGESGGGGNTPIKTQEKYVEITENGTTTVTPDDGFTALGKVSVNVNVPTSGEGGGSNYIYYDQKRTIMNVRNAWEQAVLIKVETMGMVWIDSPSSMYKLFESAPEGVDLESSIVAVCIDLNLRIATYDFSGTIEEFIGSSNSSHLRDEISITKEEFYNLEA